MSCIISSLAYPIIQKLTNFLSRPNRKYYGLSGHTFSLIHSALFCNTKAATGNVELTECDCVPIKLYLWTHKWEFHVIFMSCDIVLLIVLSYLRTLFLVPKAYKKRQRAGRSLLESVWLEPWGYFYTRKCVMLSPWAWYKIWECTIDVLELFF